MDTVVRQSVPIGHSADAQRILALDALTRLTRRFARTPEIGGLAEETLLVIAGQLGVGSALLVLLHTDADDRPLRLYGIGQLREDRAFAPVFSDPEWDAAVRLLERTWVLDGANASELVERWTRPILESGIHVISPFRCNDSCVGYLALGKRLTGKRFTAQDVEFLETMANTVAPLLSNTLLLEHISRLNERQRTILDSVGQGVFVFDRLHHLTHVNAAGAHIVSGIGGGHPATTPLIGRRLDQIFPDEVYPSWASRIQFGFAGNTPQRFENLVAHGPDGDRAFNVKVGDIQQSGALPGAEIIVTLDDITVQHESEERLFELQRLAERGMMAASIAHELNNFLGMMMGGIELARVALRTGDSEKLAMRLGRLQESATQMERFTGGLMDLGRLKTRKSPADLNSIIRSVVSFATIQKRFKAVRTAMDLDASIPRVSLDEDQIAQVLINLLNNAADAIHEAATENGEILIITQVLGDSIKLIVSDNGPGMSTDVRDRLFVRQVTTKKTGHGYGLVTCHRIIADHAGSITVESAPGRGTSFIISLPITQPS